MNSLCAFGSEIAHERSHPKLRIVLEMHYIPVTHHVLLALHTQPSLLPCTSLPTAVQIVVVCNHVRADEPLLNIGMDQARRGRGFGMRPERPCACFLGANGVECGQRQAGVAGRDNFLKPCGLEIIPVRSVTNYLCGKDPKAYISRNAARSPASFSCATSSSSFALTMHTCASPLVSAHCCSDRLYLLFNVHIRTMLTNGWKLVGT